MSKQISNTPSHYQGQIRVDFMNPDFNVLVDNKGNAAFGARIIQYYKDIKDSLAKLKSYYRGIGVASM